ncbi:transposase [Thiohalocapsa marina]|uniref:Transposase n=1 Tax=Thiohalocapsa marina TaxID=424902 RepID=A0A5M8FPU2_9GAMM|nr:transposase [Thiohalocapsa marina]KAA6186000.1 transposase [Thiohalocapsa marina]
MSRYRRVTAAGACYFFTVVTERRRPLLTDEAPRRWLREAIAATRSDYPFAIDAWVLLPDHLHCIWTLPDGDADFSTHWRLIKRRFSQRANVLLHRDDWMSPSKRKHRESTIWQRRFWEHCIRNEGDYGAHMDYIHFNPVKHGLVTRVADWPYSTFHRLVAAGVYPPDWAFAPEAATELTVGE